MTIFLSAPQLKIYLRADRFMFGRQTFDPNVWTFARRIAFFCAELLPMWIRGTLTCIRVTPISSPLASLSTHRNRRSHSCKIIVSLKRICLVTSRNRGTTPTRLIISLDLKTTRDGDLWTAVRQSKWQGHCQARRQCLCHQEKTLVYQYNVAVLWWRWDCSIGERYVLDLWQWLFALANIHLPVLEIKQRNTRRFLFDKFGECPKGCWMYFRHFKEEVEGAE
jgi:hypothetical protein